MIDMVSVSHRTFLLAGAVVMADELPMASSYSESLFTRQPKMAMTMNTMTPTMMEIGQPA